MQQDTPEILFCLQMQTNKNNNKNNNHHHPLVDDGTQNW